MTISAQWALIGRKHLRAGIQHSLVGGGPVPLLCCSKCSFKPLTVRKRPDFSSPRLSGVVADCKSLCRGHHVRAPSSTTGHVNARIRREGGAGVPILHVRFTAGKDIRAGRPRGRLCTLRPDQSPFLFIPAFHSQEWIGSPTSNPRPALSAACIRMRLPGNRRTCDHPSQHPWRRTLPLKRTNICSITQPWIS